MEYFIAIFSTLFYLSIINLIIEVEFMKEFFKENKKHVLIFLSIFIVALATFSIIYTQKDLGTFGDFFGGILNPLIGLVSVALLFLTYLQMKTELEATQDALKKQNKIQEIKNLEDSISQSINLLMKLEENPKLNEKRIESIRTRLLILTQRVQESNEEKSEFLQIVLLSFAEPVNSNCQKENSTNTK
jgi:hypothetical protein